MDQKRKGKEGKERRPEGGESKLSKLIRASEGLSSESSGLHTTLLERKREESAPARCVCARVIGFGKMVSFLLGACGKQEMYAFVPRTRFSLRPA